MPRTRCGFSCSIAPRHRRRLATRAPGVTVPPQLESIVQKLLAKDPKDRFASAAEVITALDAAMLSAGIEAVPELAAEPPPSMSPSAPEAPGKSAVPSEPTTHAPAPRAGDSRSEAARVPEILRTIALAFGERLRSLAQFVGLHTPTGRVPRVWYAVAALGLLVFLTLFISSQTASKPQGDTEATADSAALETSLAPSAAREVTMEVAGLDASGWRMNLRNAARRKEWPAASEAVLTLLRLDPGAFRDHDVQAALRNAAVGLEDAGGEAADKFFDTLSRQTGAEGLDLIYDIARFRAGTKAGKRATEILRRPDVMIAASPALRVLFDYREASCMGRRDLFSRMSEQGDDRALAELVAQRDADCGRRDPCCYKESRALATAIRSLKTRLSSPPAAAASAPP